ncbi:YciI family protein [Actinomadura opuntiae]|uniref:YciI family protein n=1 Tax=Actinomadura sp. OS1-43 TaxID=604315 RepID=UPI00255A7FA1|nr:YciI family protein [Actinomadura sp. OS1-43]MDL4820237.1 YciI family protein [Actinomadura sp. OS1-43]
MLIFCSDASTGMSADEVGNAAAAMEGCEEWTRDMESRGFLRGGAGLRPSDEARTLRVRDEQVLLSDGPFAETRDQIGGFSLLECPGPDEALEAAAGHPWARVGQIEVRPVWEP